MYFSDSYRSLGSIDITPIREAILALGEEGWNSSALRQERRPVHSHSRAIPLIYDDEFRPPPATRWPLMERFDSLLAPAMDHIRDFYSAIPTDGPSKEGYFARIVLVRLIGGGEVRSHTDIGMLLKRAHRVHLPIITNDGVQFAVEGDVRNLRAGELWEVNNRRSHRVRNAGEDRVHAIFDYVVPGERIADPDGPIIA